MKRAMASVVIACAQACLASVLMGHFGFVVAVLAQPATHAEAAEAKDDAAVSPTQAKAIAAYDEALGEFKAILARRRSEIDARKRLPNLPGQAIYLARMKVMSRYKDLTDILPSRIGRPNRYGVPADHFDADIEPLIEDYAALVRAMEAPPAYAQSSETPFADVVALGTVIARTQDLDGATAEVAGRISLALFFAETNGNQNIGNARSNTYKGSLQTSVAEDRRGRRKWIAIRERVARLNPEVVSRDAKEELRARGIDQRFNHWTAVRNGLMNAAADLFPQIPAIVAMLPDERDQMKFFELLQIVPAPTRAALASGNIATYRVSDARVMGYLRNNSIFTFGKSNRAKTSATFREILDGMWLFNAKFERALAKFNDIKAPQQAEAP